MTHSFKAVGKIALLASGFALLTGCVADNEPLGPASDPFGNGDQVAKPDGDETPPPIIVVDPNFPDADLPQPSVFANDLVSPSNLTVFDDSIYWVEDVAGDFVLKWMHVDGGENFAAAKLDNVPFSTVADDAGLYFGSTKESVVFASHHGLEPSVLHNSVSNPLALALTDDYAFWTATNGCVFRGAKEGGPAKVLGCADTAATSLVLLEGHAYVASVDGILYRADLEPGGAFEKILSGEDFGAGFVADSAGVYWADPANRQVKHFSFASGVVSPLASAQFEPAAVAQDRFYLYFSTQGDGAIKRVLKSGGEVDTLNDQQSDPGQLVATDEYIYWINEGDGSVMRQLKNFAY
tara:strand:+ start:34854 stop:35906 length:1053 start_codon:yes stop_codon:yes gene_type:complete